MLLLTSCSFATFCCLITKEEQKGNVEGMGFEGDTPDAPDDKGERLSNVCVNV